MEMLLRIHVQVHDHIPSSNIKLSALIFFDLLFYVNDCVVYIFLVI